MVSSWDFTFRSLLLFISFCNVQSTHKLITFTFFPYCFLYLTFLWDLFYFSFSWLSISFFVLAKSPQSCLTLCDLMDCNLPGSFVHGILQTRVLEWVAIPFSRGSSQPRDRTWLSCIAGRFFTIWAMREVQKRKLQEEHSGSLSSFSSRFYCFFGSSFLC